MEFTIGTKLNKENLNLDDYAAAAKWCNEKTTGFIVDKGDYFEIESIDTISNEMEEPSMSERLLSLEDMMNEKLLGE